MDIFVEPKLMTCNSMISTYTLDKECPHLTTRSQGATGMCLGGHLAFRCAFDKRIRAAVCYFATDIHSHTLGQGKKDDSLDRVKDISGELVMVRRPLADQETPH